MAIPPRTLQLLSDIHPGRKNSGGIQENGKGVEKEMNHSQYLPTPRLIIIKVPAQRVKRTRSASTLRPPLEAPVKNRLTFDGSLLEWVPIQTIGLHDTMDTPEQKKRNTPTFDFIVLLGMVANLILAVFLILYYFGLF
jgi:hypothetical protein